MTKDYYISIFLDTRRVKKNGKFPVKLRVYSTSPRRQKLYPTSFELTKEEFRKAWETTKTREKYIELKEKLFAVQARARKVADNLEPFTFHNFEKRLYRKKGEGVRIAYHYKQTIDELTQNEQFGTAEAYRSAEKSIITFVKDSLNNNYELLTFFDITPEWLNKYEKYHTEQKTGRKSSLTTISIYLRTLRTIFNRAIDEKEIDSNYYPFGKRKYQIPATRRVKKALNNKELATLMKAEPKTPEQQKAKDFWFFSFAANGMNMKDIALLKYKQIKGEQIEYYRAKTKKTAKAHLETVSTYLNDYSKFIIQKYGKEESEPESYVFDILQNSMDKVEQQRKIKQFTRFVNQHIKLLAKDNGLPGEISTYWARHSMVTKAVRSGASIEFVQELLRHQSSRTTQNYLAGFDNTTKKEFAKTLMDFEEAEN